MTASPNDKPYRMQWNDTGAPYVHPAPWDHRTVFKLDEAMRIAGYEAVTVIDAETGAVVWVGRPAMRGMRGVTPAQPHEVTPQPENLALLHRLAVVHQGIQAGSDDDEADWEEIAGNADQQITQLAWELGGRR